MTTFIIISTSIGYMAESIFGFGGSVLTFLLLTQRMSPKEVVTMLPVFALVGSLFVLLSDYKSAHWALVGKIALISMPTLILGTLFLDYLPETTLNLFILTIILIYGVNLIIGKNPTVPDKLRYPLYALAGFIIGATSLGIFFVPIVGSLFEDQRTFRASFALLWVLTGILRVLSYFFNGILTVNAIKMATIASPFILIGIIIGYIIHRLIPKDHYRRYVGTAIIVSAMVNIGKIVF
ncbi:MAG: sulfite exporter TauE/SafE family protein [Spirochaetia bacterium]|nr:sulfite exporter TauE/SafE family protein [Spirochaetia bacterium]